MKKSFMLADRFRGFYPVVVDVETAGFDPITNPILEICAVELEFVGQQLCPAATHFFHFEPFEGAVLDPNAMAFLGNIDPSHPFRFALPEIDIIKQLNQALKKAARQNHCYKAIMVGHNVQFDLSFWHAACRRISLHPSIFHHFSAIDTASLGSVFYGQTVLAKLLIMSGIGYDSKSAHSALYDATVTAHLFCHFINRYQALGGWPLTSKSTIPVE